MFDSQNNPKNSTTIMPWNVVLLLLIGGCQGTSSKNLAGPLSDVIKLSDCRNISRHQDHFPNRSSVEVIHNYIHDNNMILPTTVPIDEPVPISIVPPQPSEPQPEYTLVTPIKKCVPNNVPPGILRRSQHTTQVPDHLN